MPLNENVLNEIVARRRALGTSARRLKKPPKPRYPLKSERDYRRYLLNLTERWRQIVKAIIVPHLSGIVGEAGFENRTDSWADDVDILVDIAYDEMQSTMEGSKTKTEEVAFATDNFNYNQWQKTLIRVFGVSVFLAEPWLSGLLNSFSVGNVKAITKLADDTKGEISRLIHAGVAAGDSWETIAQRITSQTKLSRGVFRTVKQRARTIARNEVGNLNAQLTQQRQTAIGVNSYLWRTSQDERVRGNPGGLYPNALPSHWDREGVEFNWSAPPSDGHPGMPINCRCNAEPVFDGFSNALLSIGAATATAAIAANQPQTQELQ